MNFANGARSHASIPPTKPTELPESAHNGKPRSQPEFDQPVILRQSSVWSQAIVWAIAGVTSFSLLWACFAEVEQAVPAQGKLEPQGAVKAIQAPVGGVIQTIHVEDGQQVEQGDLLISFDPTAAQAETQSLQQVRAALVAETQFYQSQMASGTLAEGDFLTVEIPAAMVALTRNRATLLEENQLYRALLSGSATGLNPSQTARLRASQAEQESRVQAAALDVGQISREISQTQIQLANARQVLNTNQEILNRLEMLYKEGGVAELQYVQQLQEVQNSQADVERLLEEDQRLQLAIAQAAERQQNAISLTQADLYAKIDANEQRIAEIDSQMAKVIVENQKRIEEIDSRLKQTQLTLSYQALTAPVSGTVFDLQAKGTGYVANSSEPILKIVPDDNLVAQVFITNQDIGFVEENMPVDVRIDSFPYSEFGDVEGTIIRIGSDALPPDEVYPFYRFPAEIALEKQVISVNGREINLQSGMSVSANIKVRKRRVITMFTDLFTTKMDSLRSVR